MGTPIAVFANLSDPTVACTGQTPRVSSVSKRGVLLVVLKPPPHCYIFSRSTSPPMHSQVHVPRPVCATRPLLPSWLSLCFERRSFFRTCWGSRTACMLDPSSTSCETRFIECWSLIWRSHSSTCVDFETLQPPVRTVGGYV